MINVHFGTERFKRILLATSMAMFAAQMVEDGVIKIGGAELGRARLMLVSPANSGVGESNLVNAFFRLKNGSTKGSLGRVHIVDDEMEVERKMRVQGVVRLLVLGVAMQKRQLRSTPLSVSIG